MAHIYLVQRKTQATTRDEANGFVVVADSPWAARCVASTRAVDEGREIWKDLDRVEVTKLGTALPSASDSRVVLADVLSGG